MILTALKLLLPGQTESFCRSVRETVSRNYDYEQALEELGGMLSDGSIVQALGLRGTDDAEETSESGGAVAVYQPVTINDMRGELTRILPDNTVHVEPVESAAEETMATDEAEAGAVTEDADVEAIPDVVAAFLETQAEYADYAVPVNVTYEMPVLPFKYSSPIPDYTSSGFGFRWHPIYEAVKFHYGTDFPANSGDDIYAFADGTVGMVGYDAGYGDYIVIEHGDGWNTLYAHCGTIYVKSGQAVSMGDKIALVGSSGEVTGPHLHFELRCSGVYYNPEYYTA